MAVLEGGLLFRSTFASAGAHRWSIPTPGARRSEHQRGVLCCCALSIIRRFLVEDSEQVQVSHSLARDDRLEVHVGKGKEVALRASFRPLPHAAGRVAGVTVRGKEEVHILLSVSPRRHPGAVIQLLGREGACWARFGFDSTLLKLFGSKIIFL